MTDAGRGGGRCGVRGRVGAPRAPHQLRPTCRRLFVAGDARGHASRGADGRVISTRRVRRTRSDRRPSIGAAQTATDAWHAGCLENLRSDGRYRWTRRPRAPISALRLPRKGNAMSASPASPSAPWRAARALPHPVHDPPRILVAEDDPEMRRILVEALTKDK